MNKAEDKRCFYCRRCQAYDPLFVTYCLKCFLKVNSIIAVKKDYCLLFETLEGGIFFFRPTSTLKYACHTNKVYLSKIDDLFRINSTNECFKLKINCTPEDLRYVLTYERILKKKAGALIPLFDLQRLAWKMK